jgi:hypothetical protein
VRPKANGLPNSDSSTSSTRLPSSMTHPLGFLSWRNRSSRREQEEGEYIGLKIPQNRIKSKHTE